MTGEPAIHGRDPHRLRTARTRVLAALRRLGVAPDPATAILLSQTLRLVRC